MAGLRAPVLVTGAGGFIGRRLVAALLERNLETVALALPGETVPEEWGDQVSVVRGDVRDADDVTAAVSGVSTVFHLAALVGIGGTFDDHWNVTVEGSRNVYAAAAEKGARVIVTTSICAYGDRIAKDVCAEDSPRGAFQGAYGRAKQAQEDVAWEIRDSSGLNVTVVRPSNVYGVGSGPWVEGMIALMQMGLVTVPGDGSGNAGMVHVDNLIDALMLIAGDPGTSGKVYNVCDGLDVTWRRYFDDLAASAGVEKPGNTPLEDLLRAAADNEDPARLVDPKEPGILPLEALNLIGSDNRFDTSRIRSELGWSSRVAYETALDEIRAELVARRGGSAHSR